MMLNGGLTAEEVETLLERALGDLHDRSIPAMACWPFAWAVKRA